MFSLVHGPHTEQAYSSEGKTYIFIPPLEHALTLIPNTTNTLTTQTAIILSANYTKLEQPPLEHCEE
jgi:hypothetical protein